MSPQNKNKKNEVVTKVVTITERMEAISNGLTTTKTIAKPTKKRKGTTKPRARQEACLAAATRSSSPVNHMGSHPSFFVCIKAYFRRYQL